MGEWHISAVIVTAWAVIIVAAVWAFVFLLDRLVEWWCVRKELSWTEGVKFARSCLYSDAKWFSEDAPTMRVLEGLARDESVAEIREEWRRARKTAPWTTEP